MKFHGSLYAFVAAKAPDIAAQVRIDDIKK